MKKNNSTKNWKRIIGVFVILVFSILFFSNNVLGYKCDGTYCYYAFNFSTNWTVPDNITKIDALLVGGGGGGAGNTAYNSAGGGGGGAGGLIYEENITINQSSYTITIGAGGAGIDQEGTPASNGGDTIAFNLTALGGGGGMLTGLGNNAPASDGGSGGGGRQNPPGNALQPTSIWGGFGNNGARNSADLGGGGGGGAGTQPANISGNDGGDGGDGLYYGGIFGNEYGDSGYFAGGGGGGGRTGTFGVGGLGGGGNGSYPSGGIVPQNGMANTGGGGGGGSSSHGGADGGSGVVIIRLVDSTPPNIDIISPIEQKIYNNSKSQVLELNVSDTFGVDEIWYNYNGTNITYLSPLNLTFDIGLNTIFVWANDSSGNVNMNTVNFTIDDTAPQINVSNPVMYGFYSNIVLINFSASDVNLDSLWYFDGVNNISYSTPINLSLGSGNYSFIFYANDTLGNYNSTLINFTVGNPITNIDLISPINDEKVLINNSVNFMWNITNILNETMNCEIFVNSISVANESCNSGVINNYSLDIGRGEHTWFINASNTNNDSLVSNTETFRVIKLERKKITKTITSINSSMYLVNIDIENKLNVSKNLTVIDFVDNRFNYGSFNILYDWLNLTNGIYNGTTLGWDLTVSPLSTNKLNYSITKNVNKYHLLDNYIIGLD